MPRRRTGTAFKHLDHWDIRITLPDGKRSNAMCLHGYSEAKAREKARQLTELAEKENAGIVTREKIAHDALTFAAWSERWFASRQARGINTKKERGRYTKWVLDGPDKLGAKHVGAVSKDDLEGLVERLDRAIMARALDDTGRAGLAWQSARNVWALASKAFDDAQNAKDRSLRVREDNPAEKVRPPERGITRAKAWLRPVDVLAVLANEAIPVRHRRTLALAVYLYPRAGELRALRWEDVDLAAGVVTIHRARNVDDDEDKGTKTDEPRGVPIESALLPMLRQMHDEANGEGLVVALPDDHHLARWLRDGLQWSGVDRPGLLKGTKSRKAMTWHDLRATGITWRAIRGDQPLTIMSEAGHESFETTQGYIRTASAVRMGADFGELFPALPGALAEPNSVLIRPRLEARSLKNKAKVVEAAGIEPASARL